MISFAFVLLPLYFCLLPFALPGGLSVTFISVFLSYCHLDRSSDVDRNEAEKSQINFYQCISICQFRRGLPLGPLRG
jgi:hypothetical protein